MPTLLRQVATLVRIDPVPAVEESAPKVGALRRARLFLLRHVTFIVIVAIPTFVAVIYYQILLADRYVSETGFVVRAVESGASSALSDLLKVSGVGTPSIDDANIVVAYLQSPDMLDALIAKDHYLEILARPEADAFSRYPSPWQTSGRERLMKRFQTYIDVDLDHTTKIATLSVQAFRPDDARRIAQAMLGHAEDLINDISARAQNNAIRDAEAHVEAMQKRSASALDKITAFREQSKIVDPGVEFKSAIEIITSLEIEVSEVNAQIATAERQSSQAPALAKLRERVRALSDQIDQERARLAGGKGSLAPVFADYERLSLERQFADKSLAGAMMELDAAQQDAKKQKIFIETVAAPSLPDKATQPHRWRGIGLVLLIVLPLHQVVNRLLVNLIEHAAWAKPKRPQTRAVRT